MHPNAIVNKCVARARLQSKSRNFYSDDLYREEYRIVISKINPAKNILGSVKKDVMHRVKLDTATSRVIRTMFSREYHETNHTPFTKSFR